MSIKNKSSINLLTIILMMISLIFLFSACSGTEDPMQKKDRELQLLDQHYNEIMTEIGNLNVTGHGDFVNKMNEQIDVMNSFYQELETDYGSDSEVINLCKEAWKKLISICIASRDAIQNNDSSAIVTIPTFEQEYQSLITQIQNYQAPTSEQ